MLFLWLHAPTEIPAPNPAENCGGPGQLVMISAQLTKNPNDTDNHTSSGPDNPALSLDSGQEQSCLDGTLQRWSDSTDPDESTIPDNNKSVHVEAQSGVVGSLA